MVRDIVAHEVAPRAAATDASAEFPWDVVNAFRRNGLFGMSVPEEYGGAGLSLLEQCLVYQEVARACLTSSVTLADQKLGADPLINDGPSDLKQKFLPAIANGDSLIAFALTEPEAGSDVSGLKTTAQRRGESYVLTGRKRFITNGNVAHLFSVFASTEPTQGRRGISCFLVPADTPGVTIGPPELKMGIRGSPTTEVIFDHCCVPAENLLGQEGDGFSLAMRALEPARVVVAFQAVGLAEGAMEYAGAYTAQREQFGRKIIDFQSVEFMLANMSMHIDAARYLARAAAEAHAAADPEAIRLAAEAKTFASDVAMQVTTDAVQLLGGYGYLRDFPVERMMRDAKILQIFDGTNQIQRVIVGRELRRRFRPV